MRDGLRAFQICAQTNTLHFVLAKEILAKNFRCLNFKCLSLGHSLFHFRQIKDKKLETSLIKQIYTNKTEFSTELWN